MTVLTHGVDLITFARERKTNDLRTFAVWCVRVRRSKRFRTCVDFAKKNIDE